jgi:hypothetical protein
MQKPLTTKKSATPAMPSNEKSRSPGITHGRVCETTTSKMATARSTSILSKWREEEGGAQGGAEFIAGGKIGAGW